MTGRGFSLRQLRLFIATARQSSLAAAGRRLNVSQAAISESVRDLEAVLGLRLFDREGRRLRLNAAGHSFLIDAERLVREADDMARRYGASRQLTIGASVTIGNYILADLLADLRAKQPQTALSIVIRNTEAIAAALLAREIDVGLVEGLVGHPALEVRAWKADRLVIVAAPEHRLAPGAATEDLVAADWILREVGAGTRESFDAATRDWPSPVRVSMTVGGNELIKALVKMGLGLGCLSLAAVRGEVQRGELVIVPTPSFVLNRVLRIITPIGGKPNQALVKFLSICQAHGGMN
jgi:DNA-binding transcriptional LysR family regulator